MHNNRILRLFSLWVSYLASYKKNKKKNIWVFGEWLGNRCGDSCTYFANYVAEKAKEIKLYWVCDNNVDTSMLNNNIIIIKRGSDEAEKVLEKAGAIFLNQNFLDVSLSSFNKYGKAISINFWHGFPWKKIGHDAYKKDGYIFRLYCKLLDPVEKSTKYITFSDIYSEKLKTAFGVKKKQLINAGLPRNSIFYSGIELNKCKEKICNRIFTICPWLELDKVKIISYMPTFRDQGDACTNLNSYFDMDFHNFLRNNNIVIIQKAHFADTNADSLIDNSRTNIVTINDINAATLMGASDVLISDYSSCVFDYLLLDRPIIHFVYDYEKFKTTDRGVYFDIEDIHCGTVVTDKELLQEEIIRAINGKDSMAELRKKRREELLTYDNADSCEQIYNEVCRILKIDV